MPRCEVCGDYYNHGEQWVGDRGEAYCSLDCLELDHGRGDVIVIEDRKMDSARRGREARSERRTQ